MAGVCLCPVARGSDVLPPLASAVGFFVIFNLIRTIEIRQDHLRYLLIELKECSVEIMRGDRHSCQRPKPLF